MWYDREFQSMTLFLYQELKFWLAPYYFFYFFSQEFISSACIEHLDFLDIDVDIGQFKQFTERDKGKQFRSLTDIPKIAKVEFTETWIDDVVSCFLGI